MRFSVTVEADGDRVMTREEIVELADAVAVHGGIASGIGTTSYGAQLVVEADTPELAMERGAAEFARAATVAGLPAWPVSSLKAVSEDDDDPGYDDGPGFEVGPGGPAYGS